MTINPNYCIIVNERFEANFFINKFELDFKNEFGLFPIYTDHNNKIWLTINTKKEYSKIIPIYLRNVSNSNSATIWFFFTFSMSFFNNLNEFFIIDEIFSNFNKKKHYPSAIGMKTFPRKPIYSVKKANRKIYFLQNKNSFEIYNTLQKITFRELIAMTSISVGYFQKVSIQQKTKLIALNFERISCVLEKLKKNNLIINHKEYSEKFINFISKKIKFSFYEKVMLGNLLRKFQRQKYGLLLKDIKKLKDAKSIIYYLDNTKNQ